MSASTAISGVRLNFLVSVPATVGNGAATLCDVCLNGWVSIPLLILTMCDLYYYGRTVVDIGDVLRGHTHVFDNEVLGKLVS